MRLLTGIVNNPSQHLDKILLWQKSFYKVCPNDKVILIVVNANEQDKLLLSKNNIQCEYLDDIRRTETINNMRLLPIANFLYKVKDEFTHVIYTDVFDVVFLKDPFTKVTSSTTVGSEGILHSEEPWNSDVMNKCFPVFSKFMRDKQILCSGVIAGTPDGVSNTLQQMYQQTTSSLKGHDIEDQAALNIVNYHDSHLNDIQVLELPDKWVLHMATGGPTQFFEKWGFKSTLQRRYGFTPNWKEFDIVHQFNRIPTIHEEIKKMYE